VGIDVGASLEQFHAASAREWHPDDPEVIDGWLRALQGRTSQVLLAEKSGLSRQQVGRLLSGRARGRLPVVLALIDALTGRLPDLVGALVPIAEVPSLARTLRVREALARLAFAHPWSPAAGAWLDVRKSVPASKAPAELAAALGLSLGHAEVLIEALTEAGVAVVKGRKLVPAPPETVEVRATPEDRRRLNAHWARVSAERLAGNPGDDLFSWNVFAVGRDDLDRIREAQRRFYREVRAIVADSPPEVPALLCVHTAAWPLE